MSGTKKAVSTYPVHAQIREATGLTADEKVLLHTVASHQNEVCWAKREVLRGWTGLSERRFRRAKEGAVAKGVLVETERPGLSKVYRLGKRALVRLATEGVRVSEQRKTLGTSMRKGSDGPTTVVEAPDRSGQDDLDRSEHDNFDQGGPAKRNKKTNSEEIKNKKAPRRVRVPRSNQTRPPTVSRGATHGNRETMEDRKARVRTRVTAYNNRKESA